VGLAQLAYAGVSLIVMSGLTGLNLYLFRQEVGDSAPPSFIPTIFVLAGAVSVAMTIPSIVAGYALLKRRAWAKVAGLVAGVIAATSIPLGTAVAVYTFWFLLGETGKQVYEDYKKQLPPPPPKEWQSSGGYSEHDNRAVSYNPPFHER